jgi:UDP-glucose 4-epimerase
VTVRDSKIFVTGGAGFIGSHLVDQLLAANNEVVVFDDFSTGLEENLREAKSSGRLTVVRESVTNFEALMESMSSCSFVFHLATKNVRLSLRQPTLVHDVNTTGTLNVLKAAHARKVKRFLYCSSSEVNGTAIEVPMAEDYIYRPETLYGASKLAGEDYALAFHRSGWLNAVVARPHNNYGPREHALGLSGEVIPRFILQAMAGKPLTVYGEGNQTRDFTFVSETSKILIDLLETDHALGEVINVCRGQEISILQIAKKILHMVGGKSEIVHMPGRPSDVLRLFGDNSKLQRILGRTPSISIDEGLRSTFDWFQNHTPSQPLGERVWETTEQEGWLA